MSSLRQHVDTRQTRVVPGKHGMADLMLALKEAEIKAEAIPVHIYQGQKATKQLKYKCKIPTVTAHALQIKKTTTLCIPTYKE